MSDIKRRRDPLTPEALETLSHEMVDACDAYKAKVGAHGFDSGEAWAALSVLATKSEALDDAFDYAETCAQEDLETANRIAVQEDSG